MRTLKLIIFLGGITMITLAASVYLWMSKSPQTPAVVNKLEVSKMSHPTGPHEGEKLKGLDLSHWNGEVDWPVLKKTDAVFVYVKATQGATYIDPDFEHNWSSAKNYGFYRGAYHFYQPTENPKAQAEHFLSVVKLEKGDLLPVLDIEIASGVNPEKLSAGIAIWINTVKESLGRYPIIYTDKYFWNKSIDRDFSECPLWLAEWETSHTPYLPSGWQNWVFWQYTESGSIAGVPSPNKTDLDWFNGDRQTLRRYVIR